MMRGGCNSHYTSDSEIDTFINKVDAVKEAIQAMKARSQIYVHNLEYTKKNIYWTHSELTKSQLGSLKMSICGNALTRKRGARSGSTLKAKLGEAPILDHHRECWYLLLFVRQYTTVINLSAREM